VLGDDDMLHERYWW